MLKPKTLCLAGDGWGAIAAFKSLTNDNSINLELATNDPELINLSKSYKNTNIIDLGAAKSSFVVCAGYKQIISKPFLERKTIINIHYSLLPKYRGFHSTVWAILNDENELGLSIHKMNEYIDDGPIIKQYKIVNDGINSSKYYMEHFNKWIEKNLIEVLLEYLNGNLIEVEQDKSCATWAGKRSIEDCKINFNNSHRYIYNCFRALVKPYPLPFIRMEKSKKEFRIIDYKLIERKINTHIGRILNIDSEGIYVSTKDGYIIIKELIDDSNQVVPHNLFRIGQFL